jgi:pimeloyl-ACP methyl ester carboxylesterase
LRRACLPALLVSLCSCANPTAALKGDVALFHEKYPNNVSTLDTALGPLHFAWSGKRGSRPLVFVHGSPGSWEGWAHYLVDPDLQKKYHVIAVDRPGYGGTGAGRSEGSLAKQAAILHRSAAHE